MKKQFVRAASVDNMLSAFESKIAELEGEQGIESATTVDMLDAFQSKIDELEGVDSATSINASIDANVGVEPLEIYSGDDKEKYLDEYGVMTGDPGSIISLAELKEFWNNEAQYDPSISMSYGPDDGEHWLDDTTSELKEYYDEIDECERINASDEGIVEEELEPVEGSKNYQPFMLMEYEGDSGENGPEGDYFGCIGKFFAVDEKDAQAQLESAMAAQPERMQYLANPYVTEYNDYFDDGSEVYEDLATLVQRKVLSPEEQFDYDIDEYGNPVYTFTEVDGASSEDDEDDYIAPEDDLEDDYIDDEAFEIDEEDDAADEYAEVNTEEDNWSQVDQKSIRDYDGFLTEYTLYVNNVTDHYVCCYGDSEIYTPWNGDWDADFDTYDEAIEWFNSYSVDDDEE